MAKAALTDEPSSGSTEAGAASIGLPSMTLSGSLKHAREDRNQAVPDFHLNSVTESPVGRPGLGGQPQVSGDRCWMVP